MYAAFVACVTREKNFWRLLAPVGLERSQRLNPKRLKGINPLIKGQTQNPKALSGLRFKVQGLGI